MPRQKQREPGARHTREHDEQRHEAADHRIEMPIHAMHPAVGQQQRRDEEEEGPGGQCDRFDKLPAEDRLRRDGQGEEEVRLPVAEEVRVADHQVAQQEQAEEAGEEQEQHALDEQSAQARKARQEAQTLEEQAIGHDGIPHQEDGDDRDPEP